MAFKNQRIVHINGEEYHLAYRKKWGPGWRFVVIKLPSGEVITPTMEEITGFKEDQIRTYLSHYDPDDDDGWACDISGIALHSKMTPEAIREYLIKRIAKKS